MSSDVLFSLTRWAGMGLVVALGYLCARFIRSDPLRWKLVMPLALWNLNWALFILMSSLGNATVMKVGLNWWGFGVMVHAAITFLLYISILWAGRGEK